MSDVKVPIHKLRSLSKEELESIESDEGKFLEFFTEIKPDLVDVRAASCACVCVCKVTWGNSVNGVTP